MFGWRLPTQPSCPRGADSATSTSSSAPTASCSGRPCSRHYYRSRSSLRQVRVNATTKEHSRVLRYQGEHSFNLSEYMVVLDKPLGLTLAPDPMSGQIIVQNIKEGSPAANSQLIQVGDVVRKCSAVFGEDMWHAIDIRRMRWAINNRTSKVKLVLERARRPMASVPVWYNKGEVGTCSVERDALQLPVSFVTATMEDDWSQDIVAPGRSISVGFHRSNVGSAQMPRRTSVAARQARLQQLREELMAAGNKGTLDLAAEASRSAERQSFGTGLPSILGGGGKSAQKAGGAASSLRPEKRVHAFLQWLLIASSRMDTRDLTTLASVRGLGSMLELSLALTPAGYLTVKGTEGMQLPEINVSSLMSEDVADQLGVGGLAAAAMGGQQLAPANGTQAASGQQVRGLTHSALDSRDAEVRMLIHAAACLQRLSFRRQGSFFHHSSKERCAILLHCETGVQAKIGNLLAGWLHWYWHMPLQEAVLSAEMATGSAVETRLLDDATQKLVKWADERMNQVVVTWKYGALSVMVAGDIVGSWGNRVQLVRCSNPYGCKGATSRGHFFLPLTGLKPGLYFYKFIVDGTWTVDPSAPKVIDTSGNYNNVLEVHARPPCVTSRERLQLARLQAAQLALAAKMMPHGDHGP